MTRPKAPEPDWEGSNLQEQMHLLGEGSRMFGQRMQQSFAGVFVYERLLDEFRDRINWIYEIGTGPGILSLYFALWSRLNEVPFTTIDNGAAYWALKPEPKVNETLWSLGVEVIEDSCFRYTPDRITTGLLFCDGGHKFRELSTFAPGLAKGSIIIVHDYPIEITDNDIDFVTCVKRLEPWHTQSLEMGTRACILEQI